MSLRIKFNLVLIIIFALGFAVCGYFSYDLLQRNARNEVLRNAGLMMDTAIAIRGYTVNQVKPHLVEKLAHTFLPQSIPAYAATETINDLRQKYRHYSYKEATLNPTNPRDRALGWEWQLVQQFRQQVGLSEIVGERGEGNSKILYLARPIQIKNEGCLSCHSEPEQAPQSMIDLYGPNNGFGWQLNEIVGTQLVTVPMSVPIANANNAFKTFIGSLLGLFVVLFLVINIMLSRMIIKPIANMSKAADEISTGNFQISEFAESGRDEVAILATSFNRMRRSLLKAMQMATA